MNSVSCQCHDNVCVEFVEPVEYDFNTPRFSAMEDDKLSTDINSSAVESVTKIDLAFYFSTLSTFLKNMSVEDFTSYNQLIPSDIGEIPRIPHVPQAKEEDMNLLVDWMQVVIDEGHIEPSQPVIGRYLGWPIRSFHIRSLYVDFFVWCSQQGMEETNIPDQSICTSFFDKVFTRLGERYEFPPLQSCRIKFLELRKSLVA